MIKLLMFPGNKLLFKCTRNFYIVSFCNLLLDLCNKLSLFQKHFLPLDYSERVKHFNASAVQSAFVQRSDTNSSSQEPNVLCWLRVKIAVNIFEKYTRGKLKFRLCVCACTLTRGRMQPTEGSTVPRSRPISDETLVLEWRSSSVGNYKSAAPESVTLSLQNFISRNRKSFNYYLDLKHSFLLAV